MAPKALRAKDGGESGDVGLAEVWAGKEIVLLEFCGVLGADWARREFLRERLSALEYSWERLSVMNTFARWPNTPRNASSESS